MEFAQKLLRMNLYVYYVYVFLFIFFSFKAWGQEDLSHHFNTHYNATEELTLNSHELEILKKYKILFIPGYFSNLTIKLSPFGYFQNAIDALKELGLKEDIDFQLVITQSQRHSDINIPQIRKMILKSPKKLLVITHSKGGIDFLKTFLEFPDLQRKIGGFISIQSPFHGTEIADYILRGTFKSFLFKILLRVTGGTFNSLEELSTFESKKYIKKHEDKISCLSFPVINFGSSIDSKESMTFPVLRPFHGILKSLKIESDGLVPLAHTHLPGCSFIHSKGIDHADTVISFGSRGKRKNFLLGLLKVFLQKHGDCVVESDFVVELDSVVEPDSVVGADSDLLHSGFEDECSADYFHDDFGCFTE